MTGKDAAKLGFAVAIIAVAITLYVMRSNSADAQGDAGGQIWFCTKTKKAFELKGAELASKVRSARRVVAPPTGDGGPGVRRPAAGVVTQAMSPFTKDWTGVPAIKCGDCGEVFPLETERAKQAICPKCQWNPATGKKGAGEELRSSSGEESGKPQEEKP